jgi:hypothetical protein
MVSSYLSVDCLRLVYPLHNNKTWNSLNNTIRNVDTPSKFKSELKKIDETEIHAVPKHYFYGPLKFNSILTQL